MWNRSRVLDEIRNLDPIRDHQRIVHLSVCYDFPWDQTRALELALFRTFAVPSISKLLSRTGEFTERTQRRYDDTELLITNFVEWGYESDRGRRAIERMNAIHGRFRISNDDFKYVLTTFVCEPIRWNQRFGWRALTEQERLAHYYFWVQVGRRMGIEGIPETYDSFFAFNEAYERDHFRFHEANRDVGAATRDLFASWFPRVLSPLARRGVYSILDDTVLAAFGFPRPSRFERTLFESALRGRGMLLNAVWPKRAHPFTKSDASHRSYSEVPPIEAMGPAPEHPPSATSASGTRGALGRPG